MKLSRRFAMVGAIVLAAVVVPHHWTANAIGPDIDTKVFVGATGSLCVPIGLLPVSGCYTFSSSQCVFISNDSADFTPEVGTCTVGANGTINSISCGTGTTGGAPLGHSDSATFSGSGETQSVSYGIVFVAGVGVIEGVENGDGDPAAGVVVIVPTGGDCVNGVTQFTAAGELVG